MLCNPTLHGLKCREIERRILLQALDSLTLPERYLRARGLLCDVMMILLSARQLVAQLILSKSRLSCSQVARALIRLTRLLLGRFLGDLGQFVEATHRLGLEVTPSLSVRALSSPLTALA